MFDEQTKEPEDIFAGSDASNPGASLQPSNPNQAQKPAPLESTEPEDVMTSGPNRTFVVLIIVVILLIVLVVGALAYMFTNRQTPATSLTQQLTTPTQQQTTTLPTVPEPTQQLPQPTTPTDTDKDGLTDEEEATLRTNPTLVDSDDDGLSDADEVRVWKTDPLDSDSDNDGFPDGMEVKSGYDPNVVGGKLLNLPSTSSSIDASSSTQ